MGLLASSGLSCRRRALSVAGSAADSSTWVVLRGVIRPDTGRAGGFDPLATGWTWTWTWDMDQTFIAAAQYSTVRTGLKFDVGCRARVAHAFAWFGSR